MDIQAFADRHRLKTRLDSCGDKVIRGKQGDLYEYSDSELAVSFTPGLVKTPIGSWCPKKWGNLRRAGLAAGMTLKQNGDSEGSLSFDSANREHVKLAIKIAGARVKNQQSATQLANLTKGIPFQKASTMTIKGPLAC